MNKNNLTSAYIIKHKCRKKRYSDGSIATESGTWAWVVTGDFGPSCSVGEDIPYSPLLFNSHEEADNFAKDWDGHPWYFKNTGTYKIIAVHPKLVTVQRGYEEISNHV